MVSKFEQLARRELRAAGYLIDWKIRPQRPMRGYSVDYFNLFDMLAYKEGEPLRMIQIKSKKSPTVPIRKAIKAFVLPQGIQKELWIYDGKKVIKEML